MCFNILSNPLNPPNLIAFFKELSFNLRQAFCILIVKNAF
ncbi:hypothetical protein L935_00910 [Helicobacter pylori PZ5086]|nr:hypothetical protein L935_00910 [Helicobacter pylori PZ5086]